jgi:hypothetical protein
MEKIIYRQNKLFCIDKSKLKPMAQKNEVIVGLYAAIYSEFVGASKNRQYKDLNGLQKLDKVNEFALNWLSERGLL